MAKEVLQISGQMSLFDYLNEINAENKQLFFVGDKIFKVSRAEVYEYEIVEEYKVDSSPNKLFYRLKDHRGYNVTNEEENGVSVFANKEDAEKRAADYLQSHDVWLSSSICSKESCCFEGVRASDNKTLYAWYSLIPGPLGKDSGLLILKEDITFIHAIDFGTEAKARKYLEKTFIPKTLEKGMKKMDTCAPIHYKNLYRCKKSSDWDWSEDGYSYIEDEEQICTA